MTLRSSSWVDLTENNKRRLWQWCVSLFLFILFNTVIFLVLIMSMDEARYIADYGSRAGEMMFSDARKYAVTMIGASAFRIVITTIVAALTAFGGFAYLNDRVKLDFYESIPQKKSSRFSTAWVSGILIYSGPYIFSTLLCFAVLNAAGYGAAYSMEEALIAFCQLLLYFLGVYHLFMLAMMLTGTAFAGVCAFILLSVYEPALRALISLLKYDFYKYSYILDRYYIPVGSPYGLLINILHPAGYGPGPVRYAAGLAVFDAAVLILTFILYMKRRSETAGKTLAFRFTAPLIKLIIAIPAVTFSGVTVAGVLDRSRELSVTDMGLIVFVGIITAIVTCAIIQAVFELDIKAALNEKRHWIICALAGMLIFFGFKYDFLNVDRYVPSADKVESVVFIPEGYEDIYGWMDEEHESMSGDEFGLTHMFIKNVNEVCELHRLSIARYDELIKAVDDYEYEFDDDRRFSAATVIYRLKNGCLIPRQIYVPVKDSSAVYLLNKIMSQDDFVNGYYPVLAVDMDKAIDETPYTELNASYSDCVHTQVLTGEELKELIRMYRKDLEGFNYNKRLEELPVGYVDFCLSRQGADVYRSYFGTACQNITIYSGMDNCIGYLRDKGYDFADRPLVSEAAQIIITNYHMEEQDERAKELGVPYLSEEEAEEFIRTAAYEPWNEEEGSEAAEEERILADSSDVSKPTGSSDARSEAVEEERILADSSDVSKPTGSSDAGSEAVEDGKDRFALVASALHPCNRGTYRWDAGKSYDDRYEVSVFMKDKRDNPYGISCYFVQDEIPEFVMEDLEL